MSDTLVEERPRVFLRPLAPPLVLGFLALGGATVTLGGLQLEWYGPGQLTAVALVLVLFAFPLQLLAAIIGFLVRDTATATGMGILSASWLTIGLVTLVTPNGSTSPALGVLVTFVGVALLFPAVAASFGKLVPALVLYTASARFILSGIYQISAAAPVQTAAGILGLVLLAVALYAALALELEDVRQQPILPVLRRGQGYAAARGTATSEVLSVHHEPGVRHQL